jgi:hypothetical protein
MTNQKAVYKWSARIIGGLAVLFFGAFYFGSEIPELIDGAGGHLQSIIILWGFAFFGYVFAWFREKEGGYVLVISGIIMGLTLFYRGVIKDIPMVLIYSIPFILSGVLFIWHSQKSV